METVINEAKEVFVQGKRMALGTTQEKGLSTTYFANPFGPMQQQEVCGRIFEDVFDQLYKNKVLVDKSMRIWYNAFHKASSKRCRFTTKFTTNSENNTSR